MAPLKLFQSVKVAVLSEFDPWEKSQFHDWGSKILYTLTCGYIFYSYGITFAATIHYGSVQAHFTQRGISA